MSGDQAIHIGREFLYYAIILAAPPLMLSLVVGLLIAVFQAATSIQEQTLTFVPRIACVGLLFVVLMPWMVEVSVYFTTRMFYYAVEVSH